MNVKLLHSKLTSEHSPPDGTFLKLTHSRRLAGFTSLNSDTIQNIDNFVEIQLIVQFWQS